MLMKLIIICVNILTIRLMLEKVKLINLNKNFSWKLKLAIKLVDLDNGLACQLLINISHRYHIRAN